jgi:MYXO-CTERM domain-containing protein
MGLGLLAVATALTTTSCSDPGSSHGIVPFDDGSIRGQFIETTARFDDETSTTSYQLRVRGNDKDVRDLVVRMEPTVMPNANVKVWGTKVGGQILVDRIEPDLDEEVGSISQPLIGTAPLDPLKLAMAIVDIGTGNANAMITPAELQARIFTNATSTRALYLENSYGMQDITGKVVGNVLSYPMTTCDTGGMATALKAMVDADVGQTSNIYLWYFQGKAQSCSWSGLSSGNNTYYNASAGCVVLAQEPYHSLGLAHASSMACTGGVPFLDDPNMGCTHNEYGSRYDTMGGGCRHLTAYHKVYRTYTQKCNVVRVRKSGTFNLFPTEKPCNGIQVLAVPMPHVRGYLNSGGGGGGERNTQLAYYTVELRSPIGFDTGMKPSVLINASPDFHFNNQASRGNARGEHTWILDMNAASTATDGTGNGLQVGQTFTDPAGGVSITTMSLNADGASIKVEITGGSTVDGGTGDTVCIDNTPISEPGPGTCGDDGGSPPPPPPMDASVRDSGRPAGTGGAGGAGGAGAGTGGSGVGGSGGVATGGGPGTGGGTTTGTAGSTTGTAGTAGTTGTTAGTTGSGGTSPASTTGGPPGDSGLSGGCSCRIEGAREPSTAHARGLALLGVALAGLVRRRKNRRAA